jgi:hypothetical protein
LLFASQVFAYGGGGDDNDSDEDFSNFSGSPGGPPTAASDFEEENIDPEFRTPDFVKNDHPYNRDPWSVIKKPPQWTDSQWKSFLEKMIRENNMRSGEALSEADAADLKYKIAKGTGYAATAAGSVVGAIAAPAAVPTIIIISAGGDAAATTAGNLAEGKDLGESLKEGLKKSASSVIIAKMATGKKAADAFIGFAGSVGYDNMQTSDKPMTNHMPPPDFTTPGGHPIYK